jgi:hypothetical protein
VTQLEVTEEEFVETMKKRGLDDWDIEVALGGLRKGVLLDFGGEFRFVLKDELEER